jgi:hypothetical protein
MVKKIKYRTIDVGRTGHHYLRVAVLEPKGKKGKGPRGGHTVGKLISERTLKANLNKARKKWQNLSPAERAKITPNRKNNPKYKKKTVMKKSVTGKKFKSTVYVKKKR